VCHFRGVKDGRLPINEKYQAVEWTKAKILLLKELYHVSESEKGIVIARKLAIIIFSQHGLSRPLWPIAAFPSYKLDENTQTRYTRRAAGGGGK